MASLTQVHKVSSEDALHVIFVHGLGGDVRTTWMHDAKNNKALWPKWIGKDANCNVWTAGYNASLSSWTDEAMHLAELGEALFAALEVEPALQGSKVVLIGHSLGGLIIKSGMIQAKTLGVSKRELLLARIVGVVFVGTPHQGASLATIADNLRMLVRPNPQVSNMNKNDAWLKLLNDQFRSLYGLQKFSVKVFYETKSLFIGRKFLGIPIGKSVLVVDRNSSDPGLTGVVPTGIDANHIAIAKPKNTKAQIHKLLVAFLHNIQIELRDSDSSGSGNSTTSASFANLPEILLNASAPLLNWPTTLVDGSWLPRPELEVLKEVLFSEASSSQFLLGEPGSGKSALLVRLAREMQAAGWIVFAIKADRLPADILDRDALTKHLGIDLNISTTLKEIAKDKPVIVLIDQLDALAEMVVQHSARLRVLLDLVRDISDVARLHTVISCRIFEQKHDPALRNLDATVIKLELPEWQLVVPILKEKGLQVEGWNQDIKQVLRSPHALDIFLSLLDGITEPEVLRSFQGLLEKLWDFQILSDTTGKRRETLHCLAKLMADREVLGLPLVLVEEYYAEIQSLVAAGWLRVDQNPGRVEFRHQTLYEFIRARSFLKEKGSLTEAVIANQTSLRIRPQLWHSLGYFRGASPEDYATELNKLWVAELRQHLKILLIEFIGVQASPILAERRLVEQYMGDQWFLPRFIGAAVGSAGWFATLSSTHLPKLMRLDEKQALMLLPLLRQALYFDANAVVELIRLHWLIHKERDYLSWEVLARAEIVPRTGPWIDSLILIVERSSIAHWSISNLISVVSAAQPDEAPRIFGAWLRREFESATADFTYNPTAEIPPEVIERVQLVLDVDSFYDLEAIAEASPRAFVEAVWPHLLKGIQICVAAPNGIINSYSQISGTLLEELDDEVKYRNTWLQSVLLGVKCWADSNPKEYLSFVDANMRSDFLIVHRLLAKGLERIVVHSPHQVLEYLLGDPKRLILGPFTDVHKESVELIRAVCPLLDQSSLNRLESTLRNWRYYSKAAWQCDSQTHLDRLKWEREHRLRLLKAIPVEQRSPTLQRLVGEEERAFPGAREKDIYFSGVSCIGSPVSAEQMNCADITDILNIFNELTDDTGWDHPRHRLKGGAIQAGRALAELAKINLEKVLQIIRALVPERNEIPVGSALRELVPAGLAPSSLFSLIVELEDKGFVGANFRSDAAYAVANAVTKDSIVPDVLLDSMERWLAPSVGEDEPESDFDENEKSSPILWGYGNFSVHPSGNYPVLHALTIACLVVDTPNYDRWLIILEQHVERAESSRVWEQLISNELRYLHLVDHSRAEAFVDRLVVRNQNIFRKKCWTRFVEYAFRWASTDAARRWLMGIVAIKGQGAGELVCLRHVLFPAEHWSCELIESFCARPASSEAKGVAHAVANLWHEPMSRPVVHPILLKLLNSNNGSVLTALSAIFLHDGFAPDKETGEFLDTIITFPQLLKSPHAERLPEILARLTLSEPHRAYRVAHILLNVASDEMGNISTSWYLSTEWLLDISLQLQDMGPDWATAGSELFERMLEFNMPQAREMSLDLDKRLPAGNSARAPLRRRLRSKSRKPKSSRLAIS